MRLAGHRPTTPSRYAAPPATTGLRRSGDLSGVYGRERETLLIAEEVWPLITTDAGARRVPDIDRLRTALELRASFEQRLMRVRHEVDRRQENLRHAAERRRGGQPDPALTAIGEQLDASVLATNERRLSERLADVERQIERLKYDPTTYAIVPDDQPAAAAAVDLALLEREVDGSRTVAGFRSRRVREFITLKELAAESGNGESTVRKWIAGERLPHPSGDPRNPWELNDIPVDRAWGPRRTRIWPDRSNPGFLTESQRDRLEALLARSPAGLTGGAIRRSRAIVRVISGQGVSDACLLPLAEGVAYSGSQLSDIGVGERDRAAGEDAREMLAADPGDASAEDRALFEIAPEHDRRLDPDASRSWTPEHLGQLSRTGLGASSDARPGVAVV